MQDLEEKTELVSAKRRTAVLTQCLHAFQANRERQATERSNVQKAESRRRQLQKTFFSHWHSLLQVC